MPWRLPASFLHRLEVGHERLSRFRDALARRTEYQRGLALHVRREFVEELKVEKRVESEIIIVVAFEWIDMTSDLDGAV